MKILNSIEFGQALKLRRKELGYTQQNLSDYTGLSVSFLSDLENGKRTAELDKALYVAGILGMDLELRSRS